MRVLIIGSGLAGLEAAICAHEAGHSVIVLTKAQLSDSSTAWAQGGIAAALSDQDSPALHAADTMRASANLAEPRAVDVLATEGPDFVRELADRGVTFDREESGAIAQGREAAHSIPRVAHAGGDATGREVERALIAAVKSASIEIHENTALVDFVLQSGVVVGAHTINSAGEEREWEADAVMLATGGSGQVYRYTTNPGVATGDGLAAALRAGAQVTDLEFVQFHPTALASADVALISEAVRGDGAVLRNAAGERFMLTVHPDAELAPRDVVARAVAREMARDGAPVWLDATALRPANKNAEYLANRFPNIDAICRNHGFDWATEWVPITPAAHYVMGGIETDIDGRTSLDGLWAIGEVARTGVHGANRLASNSLLEAGVFARRAVRSLSGPIQRGRVRQSASDVVPEGIQRQWTRQELQQLMWDAAGVERSGPTLRAAETQLLEWSQQQLEVRSIADGEDRNLLRVAIGIVQAAIQRTDSVGAHYRTDTGIDSSATTSEERQLA